MFFKAEDFTITIEETSETSCSLRFDGSCNQPGFLIHSDDILDLLGKSDYEGLFIDCGGLKHVNSRFIGLLIALIGGEKKIGLKEPEPFLRDLLEMTGILKAFHVYDSYESFMDAENN